MRQVPEKYLTRVEKAIARAVEVLSDPNAPKEAYDAIATELSNLQQMVGMDVAKAWQNEIISQLKARLYLQGIGEDEAKNLITMKVTQILELAEKSRGWLQRPWWEEVAKYSKLRLAAITASVVSAVGLFGYMVSYNLDSGRGLSATIAQKQEEMRAQDETNRMKREMRELDESIRRLDLELQIPISAQGLDRLELLAQPMDTIRPALVPIPPQIAEVPVLVVLPVPRPGIEVPLARVIAELESREAQQQLVDFVSEASPARRSSGIEFKFERIEGGPTFGSFRFR